MQDISINEVMFYFWKLSPDAQREMLALMTLEQQQAFSRAAGFMRIITDKEYHDKIMNYTRLVYEQTVLGKIQEWE